MKLAITFVFLAFFLVLSMYSSNAAIGPEEMENLINNAEEHLIGEVIKITDLQDHHECSDDKYAEIKIIEVIKTNNNLNVGQTIKIGYEDTRGIFCTRAVPTVKLYKGDKINFHANKIKELEIQKIYPEADYTFAAGGYKLKILERKNNIEYFFTPFKIIEQFFKILFRAK
ncbi:MAG: hypothetical protein QXP53_02070 [Candidatus Pacearchaeota archaeon]